MKTWVVGAAIECISLKRLPVRLDFNVVGAKTPGILADATRTSMKKLARISQRSMR